MNKAKRSADRFLWEVTRAMWLLVCLLAVYILFTAWRITVSPSETLGLASQIPSMTEHLLASCAVVSALGAAFEYFSDDCM